MSPPSTAILTLSQQLLTSESEKGGVDTLVSLQAVTVFEKLQGPLTKLAGPAAFVSLSSRALTLARRASASLTALRVGTYGALEYEGETPLNGHTRETLRHGEILLVSELLGLLVTLIGENLTLNLLREAWPEVLEGTVTLIVEENV